jgi:hypothetical protein
MEIKLSLTLEELNAVMQALGNMPYAQIATLVEKVRAQVVPQVQAQEQVSGGEVKK